VRPRASAAVCCQAFTTAQRRTTFEQRARGREKVREVLYGPAEGGGSPQGEPRRRLTGRVRLLRGAGPRTNTPERQSGASGENADKPSPTARGGRLQHPLEMPPRAGHGGIAIEVVLSHTSPGATCGRRDSPYASTVPTHGDEAAAGAQPDSVEGWFDRWRNRSG
jgi:hypothetical protein